MSHTHTYTGTHTHTHTRTHACTHTHTHIHIHVHVHTHAHTHTHTHTHTCTHTHTLRCYASIALKPPLLEGKLLHRVIFFPPLHPPPMLPLKPACGLQSRHIKMLEIVIEYGRMGLAFTKERISSELKMRPRK